MIFIFQYLSTTWVMGRLKDLLTMVKLHVETKVLLMEARSIFIQEYRQ